MVERASASAPNSGRVYVHHVRRADVSQRLIDLLANNYDHASSDEWQDHISSGRILLDGTAVMADALLKEGQRIEYHRTPWIEPPLPDQPIRILYTDAHLLVLAKPAGMPVLPSEVYWENTVLRSLHRFHQAGSSSSPPPQPCHRLGVDTSGVLLCATSGAARVALSAAFERRAVRKTYRALASGLPARDLFEVDCAIGPLPHCSRSGTVHGARPEGGKGTKPAHSTVRVLRRDAALARSLVEVSIPTGRAHQIRIHLAFAGHPLVGDPLYGVGGVPLATVLVDADGAERVPLPRDGGYLLHAWRAELPHPASGDPISFCAPPPLALCVEGEVPLEESDALALGRS